MENNRKNNTRLRRVDPGKRCANCMVCKFDTELCPLNENYDPDAYLKWEAQYLQRRKGEGVGED